MIYEYFCDDEACGHVTDIEMKMADEHPKSVPCEKCGKDSFRRFTVSAVIPDHMKATTDNTIRYDKFSSIHGKKYF